MKLAEIKIIMTVSNDLSDDEMSDLCEEIEEFESRIKVLCNNFQESNPMISTEIDS